ncbi:MAG: NAD+ synthase [Candidatus Omnitrophica bacterium]|nr:NAD+ synthase [Candidatus Omnitrophota bacterium]
MIRICLAQINTTVGDLSGNVQKIVDSIKEAKDKQVNIIVFPELTICGYPPEDLLLKDHFIQENNKALNSFKKYATNIVVIAGFVDKDEKGNVFNAAAIMAAKKVRGVYHKKHLPNYGVFDEKRYFTEGAEDPVFVYDGVPFGVSICEDSWMDGDVLKKQSEQGAKFFINLSASPYDFGKLKQREDLLKKRATESKSYFCYANLIGGQDELVFDGGSLVLDPKGKVIASGKQFAEEMVFVDLPVEGRSSKRKGMIELPSPTNQSSSKLIKRSPVKKYSRNERIFKALVLGTRDYVQKNGFKKVVLGLSGGIDSALVAVIAVEAIGKDNVIGVTMPSQFTSAGTKGDAQKLAENLKIRFIESPIEGIFSKYEEALQPFFSGYESDATEENIQARIRSNILMALSNKFGWLVLTTGNKSEIAVGYCTLYGDLTGGFAIIKDVPKTKVYEIARLINKEKGEVIPTSILDRPPTAELRHDQKDEDSLPPYAVLDPILKAYVEEHQSIIKISKKSKKQLVLDVVKMVDRSEYKRRQAPPGIKISPRAFGKDWRLPITNKYKES